MTFQYLEFNFKVIDKYTCYVGSDSEKESNAPIVGKTYSGPAHIPSIAIDKSKGNKYKIVATLKYSFKNCINLKIISLPDTLKRIEWDSFLGTSIESFVIPKSVEILETWSLSHMTKLKNLYFEPGSKLTTIGNSVLHVCSSLEGTIILPPKVKKIGTELFAALTQKLILYYCGKYKIDNDITSSGNDVTVYVTSSYPDDNFGNFSINRIQTNDNTCDPYLYYYKHPIKTCSKQQRNNYCFMLLLFVCVK